MHAWVKFQSTHLQGIRPLLDHLSNSNLTCYFHYTSLTSSSCRGHRSTVTGTYAHREPIAIGGNNLHISFTKSSIFSHNTSIWAFCALIFSLALVLPILGTPIPHPLPIWPIIDTSTSVFQSHAPARGATASPRLCSMLWMRFNPRTREGCDRKHVMQDLASGIKYSLEFIYFYNTIILYLERKACIYHFFFFCESTWKSMGARGSRSSCD